MRLVILLLFLQTAAFAQYSTKKVIVDGNGFPVVLLAGGRWDMQSFSGPAAALSNSKQVIRMEHFNVQYAKEGLMFTQNEKNYINSLSNYDIIRSRFRI